LRLPGDFGVYQICQAGAEADAVPPDHDFMGLLSMAVAPYSWSGSAISSGCWRIPAWSTWDLVLGIGIGGLAIYGSLLHLINNGFVQRSHFPFGGNIHRAYGSKYTDDVRGALERVPLSGAKFLAGFSGDHRGAPLRPFVSEFTIHDGGHRGGPDTSCGALPFLLGIVFVGMGVTVLAGCRKTPDNAPQTDFHDHVSTGLRSCSSGDCAAIGL